MQRGDVGIYLPCQPSVQWTFSIAFQLVLFSVIAYHPQRNVVCKKEGRVLSNSRPQGLSKEHLRKTRGRCISPCMMRRVVCSGALNFSIFKSATNKEEDNRDALTKVLSNQRNILDKPWLSPQHYHSPRTP